MDLAYILLWLLALDAGFVPSRPLPRRNFSFTPRQLSLVNAKRRAAGRAPMNRKGFAAAVAAAPASYRQSNDDWFTYFLMYEIMFADHSGRSPDTSITVTPDAPFNGQGGIYGGAGASGDWNAPGDPAGGSGAASDPEAGKYQPGDTVSGYAALDPASAPDPAPSAPSDSSSSYSSSSDSSSSSSSYDSGSSSSSSDSGSSSGGGGGDGS